MARKKKRPAANNKRIDPYKNFNFIIEFGRKLGRSIKTTFKSALDSAFLRRIR